MNLVKLVLKKNDAKKYWGFFIVYLINYLGLFVLTRYITHDVG